MKKGSSSPHPRLPPQGGKGTTLGIFLREPVEGKVKKRLARDVGNKRACKIYIDCIRKTLNLAHASRLPLYIFYTPPGASRRLQKHFQITCPIFPQKGRTLGDRMKNAFQTMLATSPVAILIGSDSPTLPVKFLKQAGKALASKDFVLGPAEDGGYYLIGLTRAGFRKGRVALFSRIPWGGPDVFRKTTERAKRLRLHAAFLPLWHDIDTIEDLRRSEILMRPP